MKSRWLLFITGAALAATLAYLLRDVIRDRVVVPLAYLWWRIGLYYHSIEEDTWLMLAIVVISLIAYASIMGDDRFLKDESPKQSESAQGPVEGLAIALKRAARRSYFRWLVANQLARLARLFLMQGEGHSVQRWDGSLEGPDWDPPEGVKTYLQYGLRRSVGGSRSKSYDPSGAVEYLESKIGDHYDAN